MIARRVVIVLAGLAVAMVAAAAVTLPELPEVHERLKATRGDLVDTREKLVGIRNKIVSDNQGFATRCAKVEAGTAAAQCRDDLADLTRRLEDHCVESVAFATAYRDAVAPMAAAASQDRQALGTQLHTLNAKFLQQAQSFESWQADTQRAYDETWNKIGELTLATALNTLVTLGEKDLLSRLDQVIEKADRIKKIRVKYLRSDDLRITMIRLADELKGKNVKQARVILREALDAQKRSVEAQAILMGKAADAAAQLEKGAQDANADAALSNAYGGIIAGTQLATTLTPDAVKTLTKAGAAVGIIGLAPDAADAAMRVWEGFIDEANINAMEQLGQVAESQRKTVSVRFKTAVDLETLYRKLLAGSQIKCTTAPAIAQRPSV